tara:strand:- start:294 stop:950 length:657 start_codon:yes stop_codon:yes gene_type:complete
MAKEKKKVSKIKTKKKKWFPIFAPKFMGHKEIGETYLDNPEPAIGRTLKVNLKELTGSFRDQNIYVSLRIKEVTGNNLQTEVIGYAYMPFFIKKLTRRSTGKIDDSFVLETKEGKKVRLKPLAITINPVNKSVKTTIRKRLLQLLAVEVKKLPMDVLISELLKYKIQMDLKNKLKKIYPVREVIMRVAKLEERKKIKVAEVKVEKVAEKPEEQPESKK